jgi:hypothetical protein
MQEHDLEQLGTGVLLTLYSSSPIVLAGSDQNWTEQAIVLYGFLLRSHTRLTPKKLRLDTPPGRL